MWKRSRNKSHLGIPEPVPEPIRKQGQEYWERDRIINHCQVGKAQSNGLCKLEYSVQWAGYTPAQDTWQEAKQLREDGQEPAIREYHRVTGRPLEVFSVFRNSPHSPRCVPSFVLPFIAFPRGFILYPLVSAGGGGVLAHLLSQSLPAQE